MEIGATARNGFMPRPVALVVGAVALLADRHHAQAVIAQKPLERVLFCFVA